jgi:hypothetical protein
VGRASGRLRDLCFGDDLTDFFTAEWRAEDVHTDVGGDGPRLGHVSGKKAPRSISWKKRSKPLGVNVAVSWIPLGP